MINIILKTGKLTLYLLLGVTSAIFWQCSNTSGKETKKNPSATSYVRSFNTLKASPATIERSLNITGRVIPMQKIDVIAQVQGIAQPTARPFKAGVSFNRGDILIAIEDADFRYNLSAQKSRFLNALVRIMSDLKLDYPGHFDEWNTYLSTVDLDKPTPKLPETGDTQLRYFLAANDIFNLYYNLKSQEETLKDFIIHAPFYGAVTAAHLDPGDLVRPGIKLGEFIRTDVYEVKAAVSASDIHYLSPGQSIELYARNLDQKYKAKIDRFGQSIDPSTQAMAVYLKVKGKDLKEGMYLEAIVKTKSFNEAVEIPKDVITRENQVYIIHDAVVKLKDVRPLEFRENSVIVHGLSNGDQIITDRIISPVLGTKAVSK